MAPMTPDPASILMGYLIPAPYTGISTRAAHLKRVPPSSEPGTDYYMPRGTPLGAPTHCKIVSTGGSIMPATGRFTIVDDLEGGRWLRFLHLLEWRRGKGDVLEPGELFALSGASGYGSEHFGAASDTDPAMIRRTGGPHVHVTAFRSRALTFGSSGTVDFHALTGGAVAGGLSPEDDMPLTAADVGTILNYPAYDGGPTVSEVLLALDRKLVPALVDLVWNRQVDRGVDSNGTPVRIAAIQELADSKTLGMQTLSLVMQLAGRPVGDIDEAALATVLAPLLADKVGTLSDATVDSLVKQLLDEQAKRLAS